MYGHYHDERNQAFRWLEFGQTAQDALSYEWVGVSQVLPVPPNQLALLAKVCHLSFQEWPEKLP